MSTLHNDDAATIVWNFLEKKRIKHKGQPVDYTKYSLPPCKEDEPPIPKAKPDLPTTPKDKPKKSNYEDSSENLPSKLNTDSPKTTPDIPKTTPDIPILKSFSILLFVFFILAWWLLTVNKTYPPRAIETTQYLQNNKNTERLAKEKARKQAEEYEKARKQAEEYEKARKQAEEYEKARKQAEEYEKARKQANKRYIINGDGTVIDMHTNLMWQACSFGQNWSKFNCNQNLEIMTWNYAMEYEVNYWPAFAGYKNWRLPTPEELQTLVYCSSGKPKTWNDTDEPCDGEYKQPTIDTIAFPNTCPVSKYWSSTRHSNDIKQSWYVNFGEGILFYGNQKYDGAVRLVRKVNQQ